MSEFSYKVRGAELVLIRDEIIVSPADLLRVPEMVTSFDPEGHAAATQVKVAISWLERARDRATVDKAAALIATRAVALLAREFGDRR